MPIRYGINKMWKKKNVKEYSKDNGILVQLDCRVCRRDYEARLEKKE